jgi:hypothetical protein
MALAYPNSEVRPRLVSAFIDMSRLEPRPAGKRFADYVRWGLDLTSVNVPMSFYLENDLMSFFSRAVPSPKLELCSEKLVGDDFPKIPSKNQVKDTSLYLEFQARKTAFIADAARRNKDDTHLVWCDFGILHVCEEADGRWQPKGRKEVLASISNVMRGTRELPHDKIVFGTMDASRLANCEDPDDLTADFTGVVVGGFFIVPVKMAVWLHEQVTFEYQRLGEKASWENLVYAIVIRKNLEKFQLVKASWDAPCWIEAGLPTNVLGSSCNWHERNTERVRISQNVKVLGQGDGVKIYKWVEDVINDASYARSRVAFPRTGVKGKPDGWTLFNPSILSQGGDGRVDTVVLRSSNYIIDADGRYQYINGTPLKTRNFKWEGEGKFGYWEEIAQEYLALGSSQLFQGLEDFRVFPDTSKNGRLVFSGTSRAFNPSEKAEMWLLEWDEGECQEEGRYAAKPLQSPVDVRRHEKNWMPIIGLPKPSDEGEHQYFRWVYSVSPLTVVKYDRENEVMLVDYHSNHSPLTLLDARGGTQVVRCTAEGVNPVRFLCCVHEAVDESGKPRVYLHRFVTFRWENGKLRVDGYSEPFYFEGRQIEFAAGFVVNFLSDEVVISYGVRDAEAHFCEMKLSDVLGMIRAFP